MHARGSVLVALAERHDGAGVVAQDCRIVPDDQDLPDIPAVPGTADPAPSQCWGGELSGDATHCTPGFVPGSRVKFRARRPIP